MIPKFLSIIFLGMLFLISSIGFAALWIRTPALWVINLPEPAWLFLMEVFDAHCCEKAADVEVTVAIVFGMMVNALLFFMAYCFYSCIKAKIHHLKHSF